VSHDSDTIISIKKPELEFNFAVEISRINKEMQKLVVRSKERLDKNAAWQKKHLKGVVEGMRNQVKTPVEKEVARKRLEEVEKPNGSIMRNQIKKGAKGKSGSNLFSYSDSCLSNYAPYAGSWSPNPDSAGLTFSTLYTDASSGQIGGYESVAGGDHIWQGTGIGGWFYSGSGDVASITANISVYGSAAEYSVFGYVHDIVKVHLLSWDGLGNPASAEQTVHDNDKILGLDWRDFNGNSYNPSVVMYVNSNQWYFVWAWAEQYTFCESFSGYAEGGSNLYMYVNDIEFCVSQTPPIS
jgi:hypothetical protein